MLKQPSNVTSSTPADLPLTRRQTEVLALMMQGKSNKAIGRALGLSEPTVKHHVTAVLKALQATSRTEAVLTMAARNSRSPLLYSRSQSPSENQDAIRKLSQPDKPSIVVMPFINLSGGTAKTISPTAWSKTLRLRWAGGPGCSSSQAVRPSPTKAAPSMSGRSAPNSACAMCSLAACGRMTDEFGSPSSSVTPLTAFKSGLTGSRAGWTPFSICRIRSPLTSPAMIAPALRSVEIQRAQRKPTDNLTAYDLFLRALQHVHRGEA